MSKKMDDDPDAASSRPAMDDDPDAAAAASLEAAMEAPVTALLGPAGPLLRKLHSGHNLPDEIRLLRDGLKVLCIPLKNMSEDEEVSFMVRWWMKVVRELCYDTEDRLDEVIHSGRADDDFSDLLARAKDARESRKCFRWSPRTIKPVRHEDASESKKHFLRGMAGVVDPPKKLVDLLALDGDDDDKTLKVIPINGCSGVGKTTVARALYHKHGGKFQCRAFVTVSQNPDTRGFLKSMLSQLKAPPIHSYLDVPELIDGIQKHLQGKRYLIVIDDLWTASVWNLISRAFPHGDYCSRIIATSQIDDVALACCGYDTDYIYTMEPLNDHESRKIFFGILFGSERGCPTIFKGVLYEIIRNCGGLSLTIANLACLLASEPNIAMKKWMYIHDSLLCTSKGIDVINLMYNSLPPRLRTCFLYLSMYPHGYVIKKEELVKQLVAEGFLNVVEGRDREEIAEGYFDELVNRGMVQAVETHNNGEVLSCTVHQMVLDFIRDKSMEENFVITLDYFQSDLALPDKVRRLSVQFGGVKSAYIPECNITSQVRSFVFWGFFKCLPSPITDYGLLQVLSLHVWGDQENESVDLSIIHELFRLKYLKIECNITVKLPGEIRRLTHLGTLQVDARLFAVPSDIVYLERLFDLRLPSEYILLQEVAHMTSLRTLGYFDLNSNQNVLHLGQLTNLKDLQLTCSTVEPPAENLRKNVQLLGSILEKLRKLQSITLIPALGFSCAASTMIPSDSFSMVSPPPDLLLGRIELSRRCCIFFSLPKWFGELRKLCILKIAIRQLWKEDVDVLKGILSLTALTLYIQTAPAKKIIIDNGGFQALTYFKFMCAAPCLFFEQGAMPNVQKLKLGFNSGKMEPYTLGIVGFHYLTDLNDICVKFGVQYGEQFDIRAAESALEAAFSNRTNTCIIRVQRMDAILDGEEHKTTVTDEKGDTSSLNRHDIRDQSQGGARGDQSELIQGEIDRRGSMEKYEMVREIRSGNSGVVKLMRNRDTHELVALKFIKRGDRIDENVFREIVNHRLLRHPSIVGFNEVVLSPTHLGIVMEYAAGGELFERICNAGRFHEDEARYFFQQLVCGVSFCHAMQICHRDLKLESALLDGSPAPRLKICGFGYSKSSVLHSRPNSTVGTPAYVAPEVLSQKEYDGNQADVWSCGVMLYTMLMGVYPFEDTEDPKNYRKTITRIMSVQYTIPEHVHVSQSCHSLLSRIFVADPHERITMAEIRDHSWFLKNLPREFTKEAQHAYYNHQQTDGASATSDTKGGVAPSAYLAQSMEEIMKIVKEAQTVPNPDKHVSGYGWGTRDGGSTDEEDD